MTVKYGIKLECQKFEICGWHPFVIQNKRWKRPYYKNKTETLIYIPIILFPFRVNKIIQNAEGEENTHVWQN